MVKGRMTEKKLIKCPEFTWIMVIKEAQRGYRVYSNK